MEQWIDRLSQWIEDLKKRIDQHPPEQLYTVYSAFAVLFLTFLFFLLRRVFYSKKSNTIVLTGLSGSGKTTLFYKLLGGTPHQGTVTSMEPNKGTFVSSAAKKSVCVVDVPGHPRLRLKLDDFLPEAAGIVYVVDAVDFLQNCQSVAEFLYDILTKAAVVKRKIPLLIACNKADRLTAHSKDFIQKQLEKEIDKLRVSRTAISEADVINEFTLGISGVAFAFSQCLNEVTVAEASGLTNDTDDIMRFINKYVKP